MPIHKFCIPADIRAEARASLSPVLLGDGRWLTYADGKFYRHETYAQAVAA